MTKTDKKTEKLICDVLSVVCNQALVQIDGFSWLTHQVNYKSFPDSLRITCIFLTKAQQLQAQEQANDIFLSQLIQQSLQANNILLKKPKKQIRFDNEEDCESQHQGNWAKRLDV